MKNKKTITLTAIILAVVTALAITASAAYDSSEDPIISLSYLENIFKIELLEDVDDKLNEFWEKIEDFISDYVKDNQPDYNIEEASTAYEAIELKKGDAIYAVSACEIMLRSGSAVCIAPDAKQGIADYTAGAEILNGAAFTKNHMCLIPRGDGRGLKATSESVWIMVRGDYTLVQE
ncbi:MAG: hypothetical protein E7672_05530 [Ruminococcaceae bacterium]|nr:hypothetical protein [Oscillospiraceae bacterium]